ncbi:MAG: winged helix-turn-helix domain-containing protein [Planctomycetaceae bacterium]|nr:winged helix-turn-helix domain-containing protein [Planctomycetaceae bacterium]
MTNKTRKTTTKSAKTARAQAFVPRKGERYETRSGQVLEVTNGRLKEEGDQGASFAGRTIEFHAATGKATPAIATDRFYLDELVRKLSKPDYEEWIAIQRREAEALAEAQATTAPAEPTKPSTPAQPKPKTRSPKSAGKLSQLDAAVQVLVKAGEPMTSKAMIEAMAAQGLWTSPGGKTPHATLYAAILREIQNKGAAARFQKVDRGQFTITSK